MELTAKEANQLASNKINVELNNIYRRISEIAQFGAYVLYSEIDFESTRIDLELKGFQIEHLCQQQYKITW
jgi:hypothetical protein